MLLALLLMLLVRGRQKMIKDKGLLISEKAGPNNHLSIINNHCVNTAKAVKPAHLIAGLVAAAVVSALFHSSFLTNPSGILDSFRTYTTYFSRAGQNQLHIHRWYYYLKMLIYSRYGTGPIWSEALIVLLAVVGFIVAMRGKSRQKMIKDKGLLISEKAGPNNHLSIINNHCNFHLLSFIAFYTLVMTAMYSIIPYKTPWCLLGFLHGMILLAGVGAVALIKLTPNILARVLIGILLVAGGAHLAWQAYLGSYKFYADTRNPYVYAHPTTDVFTITERVKELAEVHPDGCEMQIQVICPEGDYWPLPWYFRCFANVWLWSKIDKNVMPAPIIIASASVEPGLPGYFDLPPPGKKNLYIPLFDAYIELRPGIELRGYVTKDLWDSFDEGRGTRDERRATK